MLFDAPGDEWPFEGRENGPRVQWAGDLDGDGIYDYLIDMHTHYNVSEPTLFLSTYAQDGEVVGVVAVFRTVGC